MQRQLYGVYTPDHLEKLAQIKATLIKAFNAGLPWLQIRDKSDISARKQHWPLWLEIAQIAHEKNIQLIINDDLSLLTHLLEGLPSNGMRPGLHLGQSDMTLNNARAHLDQKIIIGVTCHNSLDLAIAAQEQGASYVAFGRFFPSLTKPDAPPADIETIVKFQGIQQRTDSRPPMPIAVIGGINLQTLPLLLPTPASLFAVCAALWRSPDMRKTIQQFNNQLLVAAKTAH